MPEEGGDGDQGHPTVHGMVRGGLINISECMVMFEERKAHMESEIANMNRALDMLRFKCWNYEQAIRDGSEDRAKALIPDDLPEEIKDAYENARAR